MELNMLRNLMFLHLVLLSNAVDNSLDSDDLNVKEADLKFESEVSSKLESLTLDIVDENSDNHITSQPIEDNKQIDVPIVIPLNGSADEIESATSNISDINIAEKADNVTVNATDDSTNTTTLFVCNIDKEDGGKPVELVNSTRLMKILVTHPNITRRMAADCVALLFYAQFCPFSSLAAPHFNALPRAFPDIKMVAVDAVKYHSFNTQYGIVGVPTVMLFHNGRAAAKFNDSEYTLEMFARFLKKYTGLEPKTKLFVTSADFGGPVSSVPVKETDYCLALSWAFIILCAVYYFSKSSWWQWIVEAVQNTWREAEAQHEHVE